MILFYNVGLILSLCSLNHQPFTKMPKAILLYRRDINFNLNSARISYVSQICISCSPHKFSEILEQ